MAEQEQRRNLERKRSKVLTPINEIGEATTPGDPPITLQLQAMQGLAPEYVRSQVGINTEFFSSLARFGGISTLRVEVDSSTEDEGISLQISGANGNAATASRAIATPASLSVAELDPLLGRPTPHAAQWRTGSITISRQQLLDRVTNTQNKWGGNVRSAEAWSYYLNQALLDGTINLAKQHLTSLDSKNLAAFTVLAASGIILAIGFPAVGIAATLLGHLAYAPGIMQAIETLGFIGVQELLQQLSRTLVRPEWGDRMRRSEAGPYGPEVARRLSLQIFRQANKIAGVRARYPLVAPIS